MSGSSRISAACLEAEAERAALSVKFQTLKEKHALDMEEALLKAKQEKLALAAELAAAEAKAKVLKQSETGSVRKTPLRSVPSSASSVSSSSTGKSKKKEPVPDEN